MCVFYPTLLLEFYHLSEFSSSPNQVDLNHQCSNLLENSTEKTKKTCVGARLELKSTGRKLSSRKTEDPWSRQNLKIFGSKMSVPISKQFTLNQRSCANLITAIKMNGNPFAMLFSAVIRDLLEYYLRVNEGAASSETQLPKLLRKLCYICVKYASDGHKQTFIVG